MEAYAKLVVVFVALVISLSAVSAHTMGMGPCPKITPMNPFDWNKFKGGWYVIQKFSTSSTCLKYNFIEGNDGRMRVVQSSQHYVLESVGVDDFTYTGVLSFPDFKNDAARMRVKFPLNVAGEADYIVFKTDYDNYGVIFSCQKILVGHTKSVSILSRTPTLNKDTLDMIRQQLQEQGLDTADLSVIDHSNCAETGSGSFKVKIDDKTFSSGTVVDAAKKVGEAIGGGIDRAAEFVVPGGTKATDMTEAPV